MSVIDFTKERLKRDPIIYTVVVTHTEKGMSFEVNNIQESPDDYERVAENLQRIADHLKKEAKWWREVQ